MKRAVIFLHGNKPDEEEIKNIIRKTDTIICADGGTEYAIEAGLIPDMVLGDLDSLSEKFQKRLKDLKIPLQQFPAEKDFTDSELAITYALKQGFRDLIFFAAFGTRIDHFLANITFLSKKSGDGIKITVIDNFQTLYLTSYELDIKGKRGDFISLIPLGIDAQGVTTRGLKWELYNDTLYFGATRGVSNEFIKSNIHVSVEKGTILVVHSTFNH